MCILVSDTFVSQLLLEFLGNQERVCARIWCFLCITTYYVVNVPQSLFPLLLKTALSKTLFNLNISLSHDNLMMNKAENETAECNPVFLFAQVCTFPSVASHNKLSEEGPWLHRASVRLNLHYTVFDKVKSELG